MLSRHTVQGCRKGWLSPGFACQEQMMGVLKVHWMRGLRCLIAAWCIAFCAPAVAQERGQVFDFDITHATLGAALEELARQSSSSLLFPNGLASEKGVSPVKGRYSVDEALKIMLRETQFSGGLIGGEVISVSLSSDNNAIDREGSVNSGKIKKGLLASVSAFLFGAGGSGPALAQDEVGTEDTGRDTIIVTAQKREQNVQDVPISVFAQSGEELLSRGISDFQSLSFAVPGLFVADTGTFNRRISIRGIGNVFGGSSLVGVYVDEAGVAGSPSNHIDLRLHDIERVEVLKGPQPTLYGEGSLGGTIRFITNDPDLQSFGGSLTVDGAVTKDGDPSQELKSVLNIPIVEDQLGIRLTAQYANMGGWIDQPTISRSDINDQELVNLRGKLLWRPSEALSLEAMAIVHRNDTGAQNTGEDEDGNFTFPFGLPLTSTSEDDYELYSVAVEYAFQEFTVTSATSYLDSRKSLANVSFRCCVATTSDPDGLLGAFNVLSTPSSEIFSQELRVTSNGSGPLHWVVGGSYRDADLPWNVVPEGIAFGSGNIIPINTFWRDESESWALFGEASYELTDRFEVGAGARYFEDNRIEERSVAGPGGGTITEVSFDSVNPKFFVNFDLTNTINLYANAARGFRSGGTNGPLAPPFDPENVWSYEAGLKGALADGRLYLEVAGFYSDYSDYQIIGFDPAALSNITANAGDVRIAGVDLTVIYDVTDSFELGFAGTYNDTEFTSVSLGSTSHIEGDPLDLVSEYNFSFWADYNFGWFDGGDGAVRVDYSQQGPEFYRNRSLDNPAIPFEYSAESDVINMANVRVSWARGNLSAEVYAENLLNERGFVSGLWLENASPRPRPRTLGVKLGVDF